MQKIDKSSHRILSTKYWTWLKKLKAKGEEHDKNYRYYYDDIVMNLYKCQSGVCAYTEMFICIPELYDNSNWVKGRYRILDKVKYNRVDHLGEMDHFDTKNKKREYWNWDNLFMIDAKINSIKSNSLAIAYLKPDLPDYSPKKYFNYDDQTHRYVPNIEINDILIVTEIQYMIDKVLCLNHGVVKNERRDYINMLKAKKQRGEELTIDRFFTAVKWTLLEDE